MKRKAVALMMALSVAVAAQACGVPAAEETADSSVSEAEIDSEAKAQAEKTTEETSEEEPEEEITEEIDEQKSGGDNSDRKSSGTDVNTMSTAASSQTEGNDTEVQSGTAQEKEQQPAVVQTASASDDSSSSSHHHKSKKKSGSSQSASNANGTTDSSNTGNDNSSSNADSADKNGSTETPSTPDTPEEPENTVLVSEAATKLVDLGYAQYVAVQFAEGHSLSDTSLIVDGVDVSSAFTNVTDDGSIVKWEITSLNPAKLTAKSGNSEQEVTLSDNSNPAAPEVRQNTSPEYFMANGSVYVWDYHLTNYDASGNVRVKPGKTTFSLQTKENEIKYYSPDAELQEKEGSQYGVSGNAIVMFNYSTDEEKAWFDGITSVDLVAADDRNTTLNDNLTYECDNNVEHYGNRVAQITVPLGQSNFYSNGRYQIRVTSNGKGYLFPIHVVNETTPSMLITETAESGKNLHFAVKDMLYAITVPIYKVELTDPSGTTSELTKIDDWYLIGDTFVLYNDKTNHLSQNGTYTLKIYADGFKSFTKSFMVGNTASQSADVATADDYGIDVLSSASISGGGSTSGSGSEGGSNTMNANLIFDADLLANAKIVKELGYDQAAAVAIADRWEAMSHDSVFRTGDTYYKYVDYFNAVQDAELNGTYLNFADYVASGSAVVDPNHPYAVKYVLEDNLLGETQMGIDPTEQAAPRFYMLDEDENVKDYYEVNEDEDLVLYCDDVTYMTALAASGKIYVNGSYSALSGDNYTVTPGTEENTRGTLTINKGVLELGKNSLDIRVDSYQNNVLNVACQKVKENFNVVVATEKPAEGQEVVLRCEPINTEETVTGDCWNYIQKVTLTLPDGKEDIVMTSGYEGRDIGYIVNGCELTLEKGLFTTGGTYSVEINFKYYPTVNLSFEVTEVEKPAVEEKEVPEVAGIEEKSDFYSDKYYRVTFKETANNMVNDYLEAVNTTKEITINGKSVSYYYSASLMGSETNKWTLEKDSYSNYAYISFSPDCFSAGEKVEVVVKAGNDKVHYKDLTFYVKDGKIVSADDSDNGEIKVKEAPTFTANAPKTDEAIVLTTTDGQAAEYLAKVSGVSYKAADAEESTPLTKEQYAIDTNAKTVTITAGIPTEGTYTITITAEGYEDATVEVTVVKKEESGSDNGGEEDGAAAPTVVAVKKPMFSSYYQVSFDGMDKAALNTYLTSINTTNGVIVDGQTVEQGNSFSSGIRWWLGEGPSGDGAKGYLNFTEETFSTSETVTVEVKVDNYKTLKFTVKNGTLVTTDTQSAEDSKDESENEVQVQPEEVVVPAAEEQATDAATAEEQAAVMEESAQETESQAAVVEESAEETETKAVVEAAPAEETVSTEEQASAKEASEEAEISEENVEDSSDNVDAQEETTEINE